MIASQAGHMLPPLPPEQNEALARTRATELDQLSSPAARHGDQLGRGLCARQARQHPPRVQGASVEWGDRGARLNSLSPGIIMTPLADG